MMIIEICQIGNYWLDSLSAFRAYICAMKTKNSSPLEDDRIKVSRRFAMAMGRAKIHLVMSKVSIFQST